jgi:elongation factor P
MAVRAGSQARRVRRVCAGLLVSAALWVASNSAFLCGRPLSSREPARLARRVITQGDIKKGVKLNIDGNLLEIQSAVNKRVGKGVGKTFCKVKNMRTGAITDMNFDDKTKYDDFDTENRNAQFSFFDDSTDMYVFMDDETFEQIEVSADSLGEFKDWLTEGMSVWIQTYGEEPLGVSFKEDIIQEIVAVDKTSKAGRVQGEVVAVTFANGLSKTGPAYLEVGDKVKINVKDFSIEKRIQ